MSLFNGGLWAIEIKAGKQADSIRLSPGNKKVLRQLKPEKALVVYAGTDSVQLPGNIDVLPLSEIMDLLIAEHFAPVAAAAQPAIAGPSSKLAAIQAALNTGQPNIPVLRDEFVDFCLLRGEEVFQRSRGADDSSARREWTQVRNELVEWLTLECKLDVDAGSQCSHPLAGSIKKLLEGILTLKFAPAIAGSPDQQPDNIITLADLCVLDLSWHCIAVLLASNKFAAIGGLLSDSYLAAEQLRNWRDFNYEFAANGSMASASGNPRPAADAGNELLNLVKSSPLKLARLIEGEQLVLFAQVHSELVSKKKPQGGEIFLHMLACAPASSLRRLDFFMRIATKEGRNNFIACLQKEPGVPFKHNKFRRAAANRVRELLDQDEHLYQKWREITAIDHW